LLKIVIIELGKGYFLDNFVDIIKDVLALGLLDLDLLKLLLSHFLHVGLLFIKLVNENY